MIEFESESLGYAMPVAKIKVLGVGGGGTNMVNNMIDAGYESIDFIVANTDAQSLKSSKAPHKIQLGIKATKGLGAGANPDLGRRAAEEDIDKILESVKDADIVFLTGGLGGGTGSGALPVIVRALAEHDILTVAVVTKPFIFEGKRRAKIAQESLELIKRDVDTVIVIPNQKLINVADQKVSLMNAFSMINNILNQFVKSIADIISRAGHINVDFADIKAIMKQRGFAIIGTGRAVGEDRAKQAALQAISSPLLDNVKIAGARGVLLNISGSSQLGLHEVSAAATIVYEQAHEDANIILGSVIDESLGGEVTVTVIATGFEQQDELAQEIKPEVRLAQEIRPETRVMQEVQSVPVINTQVVSNPMHEIMPKQNLMIMNPAVSKLEQITPDVSNSARTDLVEVGERSQQAQQSPHLANQNTPTPLILPYSAKGFVGSDAPVLRSPTGEAGSLSKDQAGEGQKLQVTHAARIEPTQMGERGQRIQVEQNQLAQAMPVQATASHPTYEPIVQKEIERDLLQEAMRTASTQQIESERVIVENKAQATQFSGHTQVEKSNIDLTDLDIPAVMRRMAQEKQH